MQLAKIEIDDFGGSPVAEHNFPCPVCGERKAMLCLNTGLFHPCGLCDRKGWMLVRPRRGIARWIVCWLDRNLFGR